MGRFEPHSHSEFSNERLLDCTNKIPELVKRAAELGLKGIAITDHETLSGHIQANKIAEEIQKDYPDFKVALGNEIYLTSTRDKGIKYYHCILIAKDAIGHKQLRRLSSQAWMNSYFDRGLERVPTLKSELKEEVEKNPGHLIMTTACLGGELSFNVLEMEKARKVKDEEKALFHKTEIVNFVLDMKKLFNDDFYFEVAPGASKEQIIVNKKIIELSKVFDVKTVIGTDAHYYTKDDRYVHKAFLNSKNGEREVDDFYAFAYLQSEEEIIENLTPSIVDAYEEMCQNSMEIYDKITFYSLKHSQQIPKVEVTNYPKTNWWIADEADKEIMDKYSILESLFMSDDIVERYWVNECWKALIKEFGNWHEVMPYVERLEEEARVKRVIGKKLDTNMFAYPVTLQHYVDLFWELGSTVGAGRGSSCAGLNHYLLGITQLDPIKWELPWWRYLNEERTELGDIDLDLCPSKKNLILKAIKKERGSKFNSDINEIARQNLGCTMVATFGTETSKSAVATACRGYRSEDYPKGIDSDTANYLSSLIPSERGFVWSLSDVVYGNPDKDRKAISSFITEVNSYPGLLKIMLGIEGLISSRGSHASGIIFFDEDPYEFGCFMKTPSGDIITQYDLHDAEAAGMTKYDFLVTSVQDKIVQTIEFLKEEKVIDKNLKLREIYDKYLHPRVLPLNDKRIWDNIQNVEVLDLFQFDSDVGAQAAKKVKPSTIVELSDANGLMRLMTSEKGAEMPMEKYIRFKNDISLWYKEMDSYGLTKEEQTILEPYYLKSYGVPPSQEFLMRVLMDEKVCHFTLAEANSARKVVAKKKMSEIPKLKKKIMEQASSEALGRYIWECGASYQMGYAFSEIHALAYSFIGFQTAFLPTIFNPLYWDTACLIVNSSSLEDESQEEEDKKNKNSNYEKIAKALGNIKSKGIKISLANINESDRTFKPDIKNNQILYGLKPISGINNEILDQIMTGREYSGIKDFLNKCPIKKPAMINLIKAGSFDNLDQNLTTRKEIMAYYIYTISKPKSRLNLQNFSSLLKYGLIPESQNLGIKIFNFNSYLKTYCKEGLYYKLDEAGMSFLERCLPEVLEELETQNNDFYILQKKWDKIYQKEMDGVRNYLKDNQEELLKEYNKILFKEQWDKYALGSISHWEMESLCFYYHDHELKYIDNNKYGIDDFFSLSSTPEVDYYFKRGKNNIPIFKLHRIIGTVIAKNDTKHSVSILTTSGVVTVKFNREYYAMFKRKISQIQPNGTKKTIENGWFSRGTMIMVTGFRRDDTFVAKTYKNSNSHQLYKITQVVNDTDLMLQHERVKTEDSFEEEDFDE